MPGKRVYPARSFLAAATAGFGHLGDLRARVSPNDMSRGVAGEETPLKTYVNASEDSCFYKGVGIILKPC